MSSNNIDEDDEHDQLEAPLLVSQDDDASEASNDDTSSIASENTVEPDYDKANSISFAMVCRRMEHLWSLKRQKRSTKVKEDEKKAYLLPPKLMQALEGQSVFPLFRLLMPDSDSARNAGMREALIAQAYCDVEGFSKGTKSYEMLYGFTDPQKVPHGMAGDLSLVVQHIMSQRIPDQPSKLTLGQINSLLDELSNITQQRRGSYNHEWRESQNESSAAPKEKKEKVSARREQWLRKIMVRGLSPLEHKWLVRILLKKPEFGLRWQSILTWYSKFAMELWHSHNSLKNLCDKLADPDYTKFREIELARKQALQESNQVSGASRWEPQEQPAVLGNTISPMLSSRVYFADCMTRLQSNHKEFLQNLPDSTPTTIRDTLALQFPAICAEIKFDGERMVAHVQDGKVTLQTRNGKWYSQLYSPVLGPSIRRSLSKYRVNVILDGEVEAWDNAKQEIIPFGNNRTVANGRREYMRRHGLLEAIDQKLHAEPDGSITDPSVMRISDDIRFMGGKSKELSNDDHEAGKDCWLQYIVFDILYVDGPDAKKLLRDCLMEDSAISPGSLIHYTLLQRKIILHQLLVDQPNQVEIGKAMIIRPNGDCVRGETYFSVQDPLLDVDGNFGAILDSTQSAIQECLPAKILELDRLRRQGRNDAVINRLRAKAIEGFYRTVVEQHKMEGLVLKDLASPYILGLASKSRKFWHKFKPDYDEGEGIDVVILGASFATGLRHSGQLSSFLCGIVDESDPSAFMPTLNVNAKSTKYEKLDKILELTGYRAAGVDEPLQLGKWFEADEHECSVPDFISHRSFQRNMQEDFDGWTPSKKSYPDLWIRPEDSIVLELKGAEFVPTTEYSAGLTMRFPRINYVRHEAIDGGAKSVFEADTHQSLFRLYFETLRQRQEYAASVSDSTFSPSATSDQTQNPLFKCRFLTPEELASTSKAKKRKKKAPSSPSKIPKITQVYSRALAGVSFTVLEGNYSLDHDSLEAQEAKDNEWFDKAVQVKRKEDVMEFIIAHSGTVRVSTDGMENSLVLGGQTNDARVTNYMKGIGNARVRAAATKSKSKKAMELQKFAEKEGVLRWTFVFSIVHRWLADKKTQLVVDGSSAPTIKDTNEWLLCPKAHDYLVKSSAKEGSNDHIFDLAHPESIKMELLRALEEYAEKETNSLPVRPWQYEITHTFDIQDRWCLNSLAFGRGGQGKFSTEEATAILYPDMFRYGFGMEEEEKAFEEFLSNEESDRWGQILESSENIVSVLPLASAAGAIVSPHLHRGVTHVLCDLNEGIDLVEAGAVGNGKFCDEERGRIICDRLDTLGITDRTKLVSLNLVRSLRRDQATAESI